MLVFRQFVVLALGFFAEVVQGEVVRGGGEEVGEVGRQG